MKYTTEQVQEAYNQSSPKIKAVIDDDWVAELASQIGKETKLRIDKVDALIKVIALTLLNIVSISNFTKTLESELGVSPEIANNIAQKTDELIFQRVRDIVKGEDKVNSQVEIAKEETRDEVNGLIEDIEKKADNNNLSFKDKFNNVTVKKSEERIVDPYREAID